MLNSKLSIFMFLSCVTIIVRSYTCDNRQITISGRTASLTRSFFQSMASSYRSYRLPAVDTKILIPFFKSNDTNPKNIIFDGTRSFRSKQDYEAMIPIFGQAIVIIYNLPGVQTLNLSLKNIADIYSGKIQYWNDIRIRFHNPNVLLPEKEIKPVARAETDLTTVYFTQVLSSKVPEWQRQYGTFQGPFFVDDVCCNSTTWQWDAISLYASQIVGMVGIVTSFQYTIGYATLDTVNQYTVSIANILVGDEANSVIIAATVENMQQAMTNFLNISETDDLEIDLSYALTGSAYPFSVINYMYLNWTYANFVDCCAVRELVGMVHRLLFIVDDDTIISSGYTPLIQDIRNLVVSKALRRIQCSEGYVYDAYLETLIVVDDSKTLKIALIVTALILFAIAACVSLFIVYRKKFYIDESRWVILSNRVNIIEQQKPNNTQSNNDDINRTIKDNDSAAFSSKSSDGISSDRYSSSNTSHVTGVVRELKTFMIPAEFEGTRVYLHKLHCKPLQQWSRETKRTMTKLKSISHKNVSTLTGVTMVSAVPYVLLDYVQKGTLHYFLRTCRYELSETIKYQFAMNVAEGLRYLHQHGIVHGFLSSITCYLDATWTVKITCWEALTVYKKENFEYLLMETIYNQTSEIDEPKLIQLLYVDVNMGNNIREHVDVYSMGFLLMEIFTRKLPYATEAESNATSYGDTLTKKFNQNTMVRPIRPEIVPKELYHIAMICLTSEEKRPKMMSVCEQLNLCSKNSKGIVDIVMETLESYAENLEETVNERTVELKQVTDKMRHLLNEVLPPQIAEKLLAGEQILPEQFECVTIYFSDIVGFTNISAKSSPNEVMSLLNDLWLAFDGVIDKFDVYKVDTIGDAYMVCSGLPIRNGMEHCRQIALLALALLEKCNRFKIKHLPAEQLKIRIGVNSGSVTAGVVGSKMPQYCVFGDAVNTAARMESTSLPQKVQLSERTHLLLNDYYPTASAPSET